MGKRNVKIYFLGNSPVVEAAKRATLAVTNCIGVDSQDEADIVYTESIRGIENSFDKKKHYFIITTSQVEENVPENVHIFPSPPDITDWFKKIAEIQKTLSEKETAEEKPGVVDVKLLPDAKRILVIDDTVKNIENARKVLAGHRLTVASGYQQAMEILENSKFDVVLTDLELPMSSKTLSEQAFKLGELVPYGLLLRDEAARQGAKFVAVCTDVGHHDSPFSAAFDHFSQFSLQIEGAKTIVMHLSSHGDGKDWLEAMNKVMEV